VKIVYRGSFSVDFTTEEHIAKSLEALGHEVVRIQESDVDWESTFAACCESADLFLWTSTQAFAERWPYEMAHRVVRTLHEAKLPTAAIHLDRFWDLERERLIHTELWFRLNHVFTADGDNDDRWKAAGVNHHWLMPAVYHAECFPGTPRDEYRADVAFVGSYLGYHKEYPERSELIDWLLETYGAHFRLFPHPGKPGIRGQDLNDLYASVKIVVGDSIFAHRSKRCTSSRPFETVGRGGFLIYPAIACVTEALQDGAHCRFYYTPEDPSVPRRYFAELRDTIDWWLAVEPKERKEGQAHVRENHTYLNRMREMLAVIGLKA
jgi:hypothetical protein